MIARFSSNLSPPSGKITNDRDKRPVAFSWPATRFTRTHMWHGRTEILKLDGLRSNQLDKSSTCPFLSLEFLISFALSLHQYLDTVMMMMIWNEWINQYKRKIGKKEKLTLACDDFQPLGAYLPSLFSGSTNRYSPSRQHTHTNWNQYQWMNHVSLAVLRVHLLSYRYDISKENLLLLKR